MGRNAGLKAVKNACRKGILRANLYLYDAYPGGIGFLRTLYRTHSLLLSKDARTDRRMPVRKRMPLVRGPVGERGERAKEAALAILSRLWA